MITVNDQTLRRMKFQGRVLEGNVPMTSPAPAQPAPEIVPQGAPAAPASPDLTRVVEMLTELAARPPAPAPAPPPPAPAPVVNLTVPERPTAWTLEVTGRDGSGNIKTIKIMEAK